MNVDNRDLERIYRMLVIHHEHDDTGAVAEIIMEEMNLTYQEYQEYMEWAKSDSQSLNEINSEDNNVD